MTGTDEQNKEIAVIETTMGNIELEFFEDKAPGHTTVGVSKQQLPIYPNNNSRL